MESTHRTIIDNSLQNIDLSEAYIQQSIDAILQSINAIH